MAALVLLPALVLRPRLGRADELAVDQEHDLFEAPRAASGLRLPSLGPARSLVTVDVVLPCAHPQGRALLPLLLRLQQQDPGLRLLFHPTQSGSLGERGMHSAWEAAAQGRFWPFCALLAARPELLQPDKEEALRAAAASLGLDGARVVQAVQRRSFPLLAATASQYGAREPELWVNGALLRAPFYEGRLRDEISKGRLRALALLRGGAPLREVRARLAPRGSPAELATRPGALLRQSASGAAGLRLGGSPFPGVEPAGEGRSSAAVELRGAPAQGPRVAPVTLILAANFDSYRSYSFTAAAREVFRRRSERVRLLFKHAPSSVGPATPSETALLLAQIQRVAPARFWAAVDLLCETQAQKVHLSVPEARVALAGAGFDVAALRAGLADGKAWQQVAEDLRQLREANLPQGPLLLLNGRLLASPPGIRGLEELVQQEEERGLLARLRGD